MDAVLRDTIRKANNRRKEALAALNTAEWRALVYRELQADNWYAQPILENPAEESDQEGTPSEPHPLPVHHNGNGAKPHLLTE